MRFDILSRLVRLIGSRRGNVAILVALTAPVIATIVGGGIDYSRASAARQSLQDSLDAAALAVARSTANTDAEFQEIGGRVLAANLRLMPGATLTGATFVGSDEGRTILASASADVEVTVLGVFSDEKIQVGVNSDVKRASKNVEVALVLDVTGSMAGQKIVDLKAAANELVDIVVKDVQQPFYTKLALVPYSSGVNAGAAYATSVRGAITGPKAITGATRANPVTVTSAAHGFANGDRVYIRNVNGMTQLNNKEYVVTNRATNTFQLRAYDSSGNLVNVNGTNYNSFTSGGSIHCLNAGCDYYGFTAADGNRRILPISNCVSERTGANAYTDAAPSSTLVGRNYASSNNPCLTPTIVPLSTNRTALKNSINSYTAAGSTAGHLGAAWGWYMVAPNFGYLWPAASVPAAYGGEDLVKSVILMTDGEFNTVYCNGVISRSSTSGSGSNADKSNCNAPNGSGFNQASQLCTAMKNAGVVVYTVGFDIGDDAQAQSIMQNCASSAEHVYLPQSGSELRGAFRAIAQDLSKLRISH